MSSSTTPSAQAGSSRRNLTNEEFLAMAFKALDPKKVKVDYRKLAQLCGGVHPKSAGNRWGILSRKYGIKIKGFYSDEPLDDDEDDEGDDDDNDDDNDDDDEEEDDEEDDA